MRLRVWRSCPALADHLLIIFQLPVACRQRGQKKSVIGNNAFAILLNSITAAQEKRGSTSRRHASAALDRMGSGLRYCQTGHLRESSTRCALHHRFQPQLSPDSLRWKIGVELVESLACTQTGGTGSKPQSTSAPKQSGLG